MFKCIKFTKRLAPTVLLATVTLQANAWVHPGVLVNQQQLDYVTSRYKAGLEPETTMVKIAMSGPWGSKTYIPKGPLSDGLIQCGSYSNPNHGCKEANDDSAAAYVQSVLWVVTGDATYANNAIKIMNTYAKNLKGYAGATPATPCPDAASQCSNGALQAAWDSTKWPRAAEIIRYANGGKAGWAAADVGAFSKLLKNVMQPAIYNGSKNNGNWELSMIEGMMGIAVFNEDSALLDHAREFWTQRVPAYFYDQSLDGNKPAPFPPNRVTSSDWNGQTIFNSATTGVMQETCRDLTHSADGLASAINAAETDYYQGGVLYTANGAQKRLVNAMNLMAGFEASGSSNAPSNFCTGSGSKLTLGAIPTFVIGYNHYHNRLNDPKMADSSGTSGLLGTANTFNWINKGIVTQKFTSDKGSHMVILEPLTHSGTGVATADYTVDVLPVDSSVKPGGSTTFTINVAAVGSFSGKVSLAVDTILPLGINAVITPQTISAGQAATLTLSTVSTVADGTYTVQVTGNDGKVSHSDQVSLTVSSPSFSVSVDPATETLSPGTTASYTVDIKSMAGFSGNVDLSVQSGLPTGSVATFTPSTVKNGAGTADLNVTTLSSLAAGTYSLIISASDGEITKTDDVQLIIKSPPPENIATIRARSDSMHAGDPVPNIRYRVRPRVKFTTDPKCTTTATSSSPVGNYPITCSGAVAEGYGFAYVDGNMRVRD